MMKQQTRYGLVFYFTHDPDGHSIVRVVRWLGFGGGAETRTYRLSSRTFRIWSGIIQQKASMVALQPMGTLACGFCPINVINMDA